MNWLRGQHSGVTIPLVLYFVIIYVQSWYGFLAALAHGVKLVSSFKKVFDSVGLPSQPTMVVAETCGGWIYVYRI